MRATRSPIVLGLLLLLLGGTGLSALAQNRRETALDNVTLGSRCDAVLASRGMPHYIGPALSSIDAVRDLLDPPPIPLGDLAGAAVGPLPGALTTDGLPPKPQEKFVIWLYEGREAKPNDKLGWRTYVLFNKHGVVVSIVVIADRPGIVVPIETRAGFKFGTRLTQIVQHQDYGWPDPFARVAGKYFCYYPDSNVTFALDSAKRTIVGIAIGLSLTVDASTTQGATPGATPSP
jgi:hypothetical protein